MHSQGVSLDSEEEVRAAAEEEGGAWGGRGGREGRYLLRLKKFQ